MDGMANKYQMVSAKQKTKKMLLMQNIYTLQIPRRVIGSVLN